MNSKTLDTALLSLSVGCLVIGIYEVMVRGINFAYLWLMLSVVLWLSYSLRKRTTGSREDSASVKQSGKRDKSTAGRAANQKSTSNKGRKRK